MGYCAELQLFYQLFSLSILIVSTSFQTSRIWIQTWHRHSHSHSHRHRHSHSHRHVSWEKKSSNRHGLHIFFARGYDRLPVPDEASLPGALHASTARPEQCRIVIKVYKLLPIQLVCTPRRCNPFNYSSDAL